MTTMNGPLPSQAHPLGPFDSNRDGHVAGKRAQARQAVDPG
jgi:hypothetical protein